MTTDSAKNQSVVHSKRENISNISNISSSSSSSSGSKDKDNYKLFNFGIFRNTTKKETGCTEPLHGKKSKCIIKIVPQDEDQPTFTVDDKCIKTKIETPTT